MTTYGSLQWMESVWPDHPALWAALFVSGVYGLRYLLFAGLAYGLTHPGRAGGWGRPHGQVPARDDTGHHLRRELGHSVLTVLIFGAVNGALYGSGLIHASLLYERIDEHPIAWFVCSIVLMLVLHDSFFYWLHRAMHTRPLYSRMHRVHHQSVYPTPFAAYSFHAWEALAEALIVVALIYLLPVHLLAFVIFQTISTAYNVYGHCGREFYPAGLSTHPLGRWINTATLHAAHHLKGHGNYGLYFTFWDRAMGTLQRADR